MSHNSGSLPVYLSPDRDARHAMLETGRPGSGEQGEVDVRSGIGMPSVSRKLRRPQSNAIPGGQQRTLLPLTCCPRRRSGSGGSGSAKPTAAWS